MAKLRVEVDFRDIFSDYEGESVQDIIKETIIYQVRSKLSGVVGEEIDKQVTFQVTEILQDLTNEVMRETIKKQIFSQFQELAVPSPFTDKYVYVTEWVSREIAKFVSDELRETVSKYVTVKCESSMEALKDQYNTLFATSILKKLKSEDLLAKGADKYLPKE